jgi:hypothetical protein
MPLKPGLMTWLLAALLVLIGVGISTLFPYRTQSVTAEDPYRDTVMKFDPMPDASEMAGKEVVRVGIYVLSVGNLDPPHHPAFVGCVHDCLAAYFRGLPGLTASLLRTAENVVF